MMSRTTSPKRKRIPLQTMEDAQHWLEKSINEIEERPTSIARGNSRIACVKALAGIAKLSLSYASLVMRGTRVKDLDRMMKIEFTPTRAEVAKKNERNGKRATKRKKKA